MDWKSSRNQKEKKEMESERHHWMGTGLVLVMVALLALTACGGAKEEKVLSMYVAYGNPDMIAQAFEAKTGIKVELLTMSSGEVLTRLLAEKANPQTDVWFGGGSDAFIQAADEGLIEAYDSPNRKNVLPAFRDEEGYWTGVSLVAVGFLVNEDRLNTCTQRRESGASSGSAVLSGVAGIDATPSHWIRPDHPGLGTLLVIVEAVTSNREIR
jgi:spermidine/putrescine-binding protein